MQEQHGGIGLHTHAQTHTGIHMHLLGKHHEAQAYTLMRAHTHT